MGTLKWPRSFARLRPASQQCSRVVSPREPSQSAQHDRIEGLILALVTLAIIWPLSSPFQIPLTPLPDHPGTRDFYMAASAVIPALLIPFAIELRTFLRLLGRWVALDGPFVVAIFLSLANMVAGEVSALGGLNCHTVRCGGGLGLARVYAGLASAGCLLFASTVLTILAVYLDNRRSLVHRPSLEPIEPDQEG